MFPDPRLFPISNRKGGMPPRLDRMFGYAEAQGNYQTIPAGGAVGDFVATRSPEKVVQYKLVLTCNAADGVVIPARTGVGLTFICKSSIQSEQTIRRIFVGAGESTVLYIPARSLNIEAVSNETVDLRADYGISQGVPGMSTWFSREIIAAGGETDIQPPSFAKALYVFGTAASTLRGYGPGGVLLFTTPVAAGSQAFSRVPGISLTLESPGGSTIMYSCSG